MMRSLAVAAIFCALTALFVPSVAGACSPVPPPPPAEGETDAAYKARIEAMDAEQRREGQRLLVERAARIVLVEMVSTTLDSDHPNWPAKSSRLRPLETLKGDPLKDDFTVLGDDDPCVSNGWRMITQASPGDNFVVFLAQGALAEAFTIAFTPEMIVDPNLKTALGRRK